jgi:hypothetical protein
MLSARNMYYRFGVNYFIFSYYFSWVRICLFIALARFNYVGIYTVPMNN